jgi:septal ring-binding cell division protein DamX
MSFEGEIGEIDLVERLVELGSEQFTGAIRFESDGIIKIVYFKGGDILSASTNDRTDAIDEILQRANKVTREHIKQALAKRKESETLGDALLGLGFITRKELTWARRVQVIGIIRSIIGWSTGSYTIVADYLPKREEGTLYSLAQIIVELIVTDSDRSKSEQAMDSGNAVFEKSPQFDDAFRRLGLNEDAEQIVAQIDGTNTAAEVASRSGKDIFNVYKLLEALRALRLVTRTSKPPVQHEVSLPAAANPWDVENPDFTLDDDVAPPVSSAPVEEWAPSPENATMEIPAVNLAGWETAQATPPTPSRSVWDEPEDDDQFSGTEVLPSPVLSSGTAHAAEPEWGFDEAQIEAARRAAVPVRAKEDSPKVAVPKNKPSKSGSRAGLWVLIVLLLALGAGAYPAWQWWQARNVPEPIAAVHRANSRKDVVPPTGSAPQTAGTSTTTIPAVLSTQANTTTVAPPPALSSMATQTLPMPKQTPLPPKQAPVAAKQAPATAGAISRPAQPKPSIAKVAPVPASTAAATTPHLERTAGGAATITNTPSASAPASDATRGKYDAMARDFAAQESGNYTVQFELVCETASVTRALNASREKVWFVPISFRGRPCYRVFWGRFETSAEAIAASKQMPADLGATPVVVKIPR